MNNNNNNNFNYDQFVNNVKSIKNVKNINNTDNSVITIEYNDGLQLKVYLHLDSYHKFYTIMEGNQNSKYYYVGPMPHDNFKDLYEEIYRMSSPNTREKMCKSNYFKSYF